MKFNIKNLSALIAAFLLPSAAHADTQANVTNQKKPVIINSVQGNMPRKYAIVYTTIINDPNQKEKNGSPKKPIVSRSVLGYINGDSGKTSQYVNKPITIPLKEITITSDIPDQVAKIAGKINPKAGKVGTALATLANIGMDLAGKQLTEKFGNDPITLNLIEILPSKYYRINETTGSVEVTKDFYTDFKAANQLMKSYVPAAKAWNAAITPYNKAYNAWAARDIGRSDQAEIDRLKNMYATTVKPALEAKLNIETQLERYAMHRIAIMPSFAKPGTSCSAIGYQGPWSLSVYFYIGAKQTNIFNVDFCVKNVDNNQQIIINMLPNQVDDKGNFQAGGVRLAATDDKSATFPVSTGAQRVNTASTQSRLLNWYDEMIVQAGADNINSYLVSFDVNKLRDAAKGNPKVAKAIKDVESEEAEEDDSAPDEPEEESEEDEKPSSSSDKNKDKNTLSTLGDIFKKGSAITDALKK